MKNISKLKNAVLASLLVGSFQASAATINFDGTGAPCCFSYTAPLTNYYSDLGITFSGIGGMGGSILNQSGGFGFNALSGTDFLAFNTSSGTGYQERISFSDLQTSVSIYIASVTNQTATLSAYNRGGRLIDSVSLSPSSAWQQLTVSGSAIGSVVIQGPNQYFALDNLSFVPQSTSSVPEPTTVALLGLGLIGFAASRRKAAKH